LHVICVVLFFSFWVVEKICSKNASLCFAGSSTNHVAASNTLRDHSTKAAAHTRREQPAAQTGWQQLDSKFGGSAANVQLAAECKMQAMVEPPARLRHSTSLISDTI